MAKIHGGQYLHALEHASEGWTPLRRGWRLCKAKVCHNRKGVIHRFEKAIWNVYSKGSSSVSPLFKMMNIHENDEEEEGRCTNGIDGYRYMFTRSRLSKKSQSMI